MVDILCRAPAILTPAAVSQKDSPTIRGLHYAVRNAHEVIETDDARRMHIQSCRLEVETVVFQHLGLFAYHEHYGAPERYYSQGLVARIKN